MKHLLKSILIIVPLTIVIISLYKSGNNNDIEIDSSNKTIAKSQSINFSEITSKNINKSIENLVNGKIDLITLKNNNGTKDYEELFSILYNLNLPIVTSEVDDEADQVEKTKLANTFDSTFRDLNSEDSTDDILLSVSIYKLDNGKLSTCFEYIGDNSN